MLSDDEIVGTCSLVLFGGHETTTNLISSSTHALLRNPDQMEKLRNDPSLITTAVEEFLRYDGPSKSMVRIALEDFELRGKPIKTGQRLLLLQSAANHDPERFTDPDSLDITRQPNPHVAFGYGIHFCLGAPLARIETAVTINTILRRLPNLRFDVDPSQLGMAATNCESCAESLASGVLAEGRAMRRLRISVDQNKCVGSTTCINTAGRRLRSMNRASPLLLIRKAMRKRLLSKLPRAAQSALSPWKMRRRASGCFRSLSSKRFR